MATMGPMTEQDLLDGHKFADELLARIETMRPAAAIAGLAMAMAATAILAQCGLDAPAGLFCGFYERLARDVRRG